jgi:hypothetical protein
LAKLTTIIPAQKGGGNVHQYLKEPGELFLVAGLKGKLFERIIFLLAGKKTPKPQWVA